MDLLATTAFKFGILLKKLNSHLLCGAIGVVAIWATLAPFRTLATTSLSCSSPDGNIIVNVNDAAGNLSFSAVYRGVIVVESSPLGVARNGANLGTGATILRSSAYSTNELFTSRSGHHVTATNKYLGQNVTITNGTYSACFGVNLRVFDNGFALRYEFANSGSNNITSESTGFVVPPNSTVWGDTNTSNYEKFYVARDITEWSTNTDFGPPVTIQLAGAAGFLAFTESTLGVFGNPFLRKTGTYPGRLLKVEYPKNQDGSTGANVNGAVNTPWNVVMIGSDLNMLVNNDIVECLAPAPDPVLFPEGTDTAWATEGRSVWDWLRRYPGGITPTNSMLDALWASRMGFEYVTIDEGWESWTNSSGVVDPWPLVAQVVTYSRSLGVKIMIWKRSSELNTAGKRQAFFQKLQFYGVHGFKADFFDFNSVSSAARERIALQESLLREAAAYHLVVNMHGCSKPTGQFRTYPNLLGCEGVFGKEQWPNAWMVATVPFFRFLAGPADFTPLEFGGNKAFEVAHLINMPGPLITFAERSDNIAKSPFASLIRAVPFRWDETIVLPQSKLGVTTATARRKGDEWFIGIMNATATQSWNLPLAFLSSNVTYQAEIIRQDSNGLEITNVTRNSNLAVSITTTNGSGFVAHFYRPTTAFVNTNNLIKGTVIGTSGSWGGAGNTRDKVFDNNLSSYFDSPHADGDWTGIDFGNQGEQVVSFIRYCPRSNWSGRTVAGVFEGANSPDFSDAVTLATVNFAPPEGRYSTAIVTNESTFRYARYVSPPEGYCNISEIQFYTRPKSEKISFSKDSRSNQLSLDWPNGGALLSATNIYGPWTVVDGQSSPSTVTQTQSQGYFRIQYQ